MKTLDRSRLLMKNYKLKYIFISISILSILLFAFGLILKSKSLIQAKNNQEEPNGNTIIDLNNPEFQFELPKDSTKNFESGWESVETGGYYQNQTKKPHFSKKHFYSTPSHVNGASDADFFLKNTNEHLLINSFDSIGAFNAGNISYPTFNLYGVKTDEHANHIKQVNFFDGTDRWNENANKIGWVEKASSEITQISENKYGFIYFGQKKDDLEKINRLVTFDKELENFSWKELTDINGNVYKEPDAQRYLKEQKQEDGTNLLFGYTSQAHTQKNKLQINDVAFSTLKINTQYLMDFTSYEEVHGQKPKKWYIYATDMKKVSPEIFTGVVKYSSHDNATGKTDVFYVWDKNGKIINKMVTPRKNESIKIMSQISAKKNKVYFQVTRSTQVDLMEYDVITNKIKTINTFGPNTNLNIYDSNDTVFETSYEFNGYVSSYTNGLAGFVENPGAVLGTMDENFKVINVNSIPADAYTTFNTFKPTNDPETYFITGQTRSRTISIPSNGSWIDKIKGTASDPIYGTILKSADFAPGIKFQNSLTVNNSTLGLDWDKALLSGVQVTDTYDLDPNKGNKTQAWLDTRINRNPLKTDLPIDWSALGLNKTITGPQKVKYFITDSSMQTTAASRWINTISDQTMIKENIYFDTQNFSIPLAKVFEELSDKNKFKNFAKTKIWNEITHEVYEDGANQIFSEKVTVNQEQLKNLQNATEAKPYPVDVTIEVKPNSGATNNSTLPEQGSNDDDVNPGGTGTGGNGWVGSGSEPIKITNRVWVFVTTKNTVTDPKAGVVIYADDYSLPLQSARNEQLNDVLTKSQVRVYNYYDTDHETDSSLPTIADSKNTVGLDVKNMDVITLAQSPGLVQPEISFNWDQGEAITAPDVTLYAELLLHTKQVILNETAELPVPSNGYLRLAYGSEHEINVTLQSGIEQNAPSYVTNTVDFKQVTSGNEINFYLYIPEYYNYKGYTVTNENIPHESSKLNTEPYTYRFLNENYEIWLTYYIEPNNTKTPQAYSWDYTENKFGKINTNTGD